VGHEIAPTRIVGAHYGLNVAIELLLKFVGHGIALVNLQSNE